MCICVFYYEFKCVYINDFSVCLCFGYFHLNALFLRLHLIVEQSNEHVNFDFKYTQQQQKSANFFLSMFPLFCFSLLIYFINRTKWLSVPFVLFWYGSVYYWQMHDRTQVNHIDLFHFIVLICIIILFKYDKMLICTFHFNSFLLIR